MLSKTKHGGKSQTTGCISSGCNLSSEVICNHCQERYCRMCFICHQKHIAIDVESISEKISLNREQGVSEVTAFIDKQAKDAHEQAQQLIDDAINRIVKASQNIYTHIENRRIAKVVRFLNLIFLKENKFILAQSCRRIFRKF